MVSIKSLSERLAEGLFLPACPLALTDQRQFDPRRQRALFRYYLDAGADGLAVGVHTTQFAIRDPRHGLFRVVLQLAIDTIQEQPNRHPKPIAVGGVCGSTPQAIAEAGLLRDLGFHTGLLSLAALRDASEDRLLDHCRAVADIIPLFGFYLQPAVGGPLLSHRFWLRFAEIPNVVAIKIAPFNRYHTIDVVRAIAESGRTDIALYTGNDDQILLDLLTPFRFQHGSHVVERRIVGGLLGHWAVWTRTAVQYHAEARRLAQDNALISPDWLRRHVEITDANAAFFDAANQFAGCVPGLHEVLRRQGLLETTHCLDPREVLSPGQVEEIDRVYRAYPELNDDAFVRAHLEDWLR
jgi:dihydrodipicolinate synthase/N-acetylneuraminate lyase